MAQVLLPGQPISSRPRVLQPPVVAAPSWSPADLGSTLKVWLKDSGLAGADGDPISTWTDSSGTAHDFTQATGAARPTKKTAILNGKDVARFDGVDDKLVGGDLSALFPSAATFFIVAAVADTGYSLYQHRPASDGYWRYSGDGNGYMDVFRSARVAAYPPNMPSTGDHYFTVVSSGSTWQVYKDGVAQTAQVASYAAGTEHILGADGGAGGGPFTGDIAEVIICDTELSAGDLSAVHGYITGRFGI